MPDAIQLAWTATACVQYTIEYRKHDSDENWSIHLPPQPGRATVKDLRADTNYDFRISAQKGALNGPPSNILQIPTAARVPRWEDLVTDTDRRPDVDVSRVQMLLFTVVSAIFDALNPVLGENGVAGEKRPGASAAGTAPRSAWITSRRRPWRCASVPSCSSATVRVR